MKVIGYLRVSTNRQASDGHGLDAQRIAIQQRADQNGWEVTWVDDPGVSGKKDKRPGLDYALHMLQTHQADALVVSRLDRLARSVLHFSSLLKTAQKSGWNLVVINPDFDLSTSHGKLVANILASVAEFESEIISERTKDALAAAKTKNDGKPITGPKPKVIPDETIARIVTLHDENRTLANIAFTLTTEGFPLPSGRCGEWQPTQVRRVLAGSQR